MKGKDIKLNEEHAVRFVTKGQDKRGLPRTSTVRKCLVVDKRSNGHVVISYDGHRCTNLAQYADRLPSALLLGELTWEPARVLGIVSANDFIAPWADWTPPGVADGRVDLAVDQQYVVGGVTVTQPGLVAS